MRFIITLAVFLSASIAYAIHDEVTAVRLWFHGPNGITIGLYDELSGQTEVAIWLPGMPTIEPDGSVVNVLGFQSALFPEGVNLHPTEFYCEGRRTSHDVGIWLLPGRVPVGHTGSDQNAEWRGDNPERFTHLEIVFSQDVVPSCPARVDTLLIRWVTEEETIPTVDRTWGRTKAMFQGD